jgi:hypothetical protein
MPAADVPLAQRPTSLFCNSPLRFVPLRPCSGHRSAGASLWAFRRSLRRRLPLRSPSVPLRHPSAADAVHGRRRRHGLHRCALPSQSRLAAHCASAGMGYARTPSLLLDDRVDSRGVQGDRDAGQRSALEGPGQQAEIAGASGAQGQPRGQGFRDGQGGADPRRRIREVNGQVTANLYPF